MMRPRSLQPLWLAGWLAMQPVHLFAHSGPPFPIISDRQAGPYEVSVWTDPDATDDRVAAGQFWVMLRLVDDAPLPADTRATVTIRPADRAGIAQRASAAPVDGDVSRQFVALLMDHEGPFAVQVAIAGSRGPATLDGTVQATYDMRPARWLLALYVLPFLAVGFLWLKLLLRRRTGAAKR
jgi:hypothetical protein